MTTILSDKSVNIPFGGFFTHLIIGSFFALLAIWSFFIPSLFSYQRWSYIMGWGLSIVLVCIIAFLPIIVASDVGDRIPEVVKARKKDLEIDGVKIKHRYLSGIVILTILSFWSGFGWIIALAWACSPGKVVIPDKIFDAAFGGDQAPDLEAASTLQSVESKLVGTLEIELKEVTRLHEARLISDEEAEARRRLVLSR